MKKSTILTVLIVCVCSNLYAENSFTTIVSWFLGNSKTSSDQTSQQSPQPTTHDEKSVIENKQNQNSGLELQKNIAEQHVAQPAVQHQGDLAEKNKNQGFVISNGNALEKTVEKQDVETVGLVIQEVTSDEQLNYILEIIKQEFAEEEIDAMLLMLWKGNEPRNEEKEKFLLMLDFLLRQESGPKRIFSATRHQSVKSQYSKLLETWQSGSIIDKQFAQQVQDLLQTAFLKTCIGK